MKVGYAPSVDLPGTRLGYQQEADMSLLNQGVRGLTNALDNIGSNYDKEQDKAARFKALTDLTDFQQTQSDKLAQLKQDSVPGSKDLPVQWDNSINADKEKFVAGLPEKLKPEFGWRIDQFHMGGHGDIRDFQTKQNEEFYKTGTKDVTDKAVQQVDKDPSIPNLQVQQQKTEEVIDKSGLSNLDKAKAKQEARQKLQGTSLYHQKLAGNEATSFPSYIEGHEGFRSRAYPDHNTTTHAFAGYRVGFGSDTVTWADGTVHPVTAGTVITRADAVRDANRRFTQDYEPHARASIGPNYDKFDNATKIALGSVAHNYGSLPKSVIAAARTGDKEVLAQAVQNLPANRDRRMKEANLIRAGGDVGSLPAYSDVTADQRTYIDNQVGQQLRATIPDQVNDSIAATRTQGSYNGHEPSQEEFHKAWPDNGEAKFQDYQTAKEGAGWEYQFSSMSESDINKVIGDTKANIPTGSGAAEAEKSLNSMVTAKNRIMTDRNAAPADAAYNSFPEIANAWQQVDLQNPESARTAIALTLDKQSQLGIAPSARQPLPSAVVSKVGEVMNNPARPPQERASAFIALMNITQDPTQQEAILHQLTTGENHLPDTVEAAAIAVQRGDVEAANRLFQAAMLKPDEVPLTGTKKDVEDKSKNIEDALRVQLTAADSLGDTYYGLPYGNPDNNRRATRDMELLKTLTKVYMQKGTSDEVAAANRAVQDLIGDQKPFHVTLSGGRGVSANILVPTPTYEAMGAVNLSFQDRLNPLSANKRTSILEKGFNVLVPQVEAVFSERAMAANDKFRPQISDPVAMTALKMTPQEQFLYQHHLSNLQGSGKVINPDKSISTIKNTTVEIKGRTYVLPTIWNGKELSVHDAVTEARKAGLQSWPSYATEKQAEDRYNQLHGMMEKDTERFQNPPAGVLPEPVIQTRVQAAIDEAMSTGVFRRFGNQIGFYLPNQAKFLQDRNGNAMTWDLPQIIDLGMAQ